MKIEQLYEKCLSQSSYYIEHNGIAVIIDPLRDIDRYMELAKRDRAEIRYIFETHFHADFVSGHIELAKKTAAKIVFGPGAKTGFHACQGTDGEEFDLNGIKIEMIHTPGHTPESVCYLLYNELGETHALFTGDTLFLGDVGRPDLAQEADASLSSEKLAGMLFDSLRSKILPLPDHTIIYPGHGAGSACGKNISKELSGTLGGQRNTNYALATDLSRQLFIDMLCDNLPAPPAYFPMNVGLNSTGYQLHQEALNRGLQALSPEEFKVLMLDSGSLVLDTRSAEQFSKSHIPGSVNIGLDGGFAPWVGNLIPFSQTNILLVCEKGREMEAVRRLGRIGYDQCAGYLSGGIHAWKEKGFATDKIQNIPAADFYEYQIENSCSYIDVRAEKETAAGSISGAIQLPLSADMNLGLLSDKSAEYLVYCAGGYRSMIFISMAKARGFHRLVNVSGGYQAIAKLQKT